LGEAVASALADSVAGDEVVIVDDGSTDSPDRVVGSDPRVRLVAQPALGIVAALERARGVARHPFLARLDCDDVVVPGRIDAQMAAFEQDDRLVAVGGRARPIADDGTVPEGMQRYVEWVNALRDPHRELLVESPMFHPATTLRASAVAAVGGYRSGDFPEDYDLFLRLSHSGRLANLDQLVLHWRDRPGRLTRTDPRYARPAFASLKREWLVQRVLAQPRRVVLWGAGAEGKPWLRWLREGGHQVELIDIGAGRSARFTSRDGIAVRPPDELEKLAFDVLLIAVGARGARDQIRGEVQRMRPELVEGRDWFALA
jgi:hypothetical protein